MEVINIAYIRIKNIHGRKYKYLVTGKRINGVVQQKVVKYLGPIEPIYLIQKKRKSNASLFVRQLSEQEHQQLTKVKKSGNIFSRDRAKIILFSFEGFSSLLIGEKLSYDVRKVRTAIKEFNKKGLQALQRGKAKGAIPKFDKVKRSIILMHFSKEPRSFNYHFTTWTLPRFRQHLIDYNVVDSISMERLRQIIMQAGGKLKRSKRWQYSPDEEFDKKNKE
mgnify:CR=1 FL=1|tara:strand:- start:862 stop:1524 length:663 start_codon:yes stop_codon:yes gene_type:complete